MPVKFDLGEYLADVFVETGTGDGGNVIKAIRAGFPDIHSVEISPELYGVAQDRVGQELNRSSRRSNVMLYCGHAVVGLEQVCEAVQHKRATILLDAYAGGNDGAARPLLDEIRVVRRWFQDSLILPVVMVGGIKHGTGSPSLADIIEALLDLCDGYQFRILDDDTRRNVLAALPPTWTQAG